jgi:hypothetical protein
MTIFHKKEKYLLGIGQFVKSIQRHFQPNSKKSFAQMHKMAYKRQLLKYLRRIQASPRIRTMTALLAFKFLT